MKVFILAGGFGTRLAQYTKLIPKPMIKVGGNPIIVHIMSHYCNFGFKDVFEQKNYQSQYFEYF